MKTLILFDVDGTLTESRQKIKDDMIGCLYRLKNKENIDIGIVGGSDYIKLVEQLGEDTIKLFKYVFSENGLVAFKEGNQINNESLVKKLGEPSFEYLINSCLNCLSKCESTCKRGNFIELRNGMINISPIGRSCSQKERETFFEQDKKFKYRENLIKCIKGRWEELMYESEENETELKFSIGGMISIDIFPKGWDKTYCLNLVEDDYEKIYFFGDKTFEGGNDFEIFNDSRTEGYSVESPLDTIKIINEKIIKDGNDTIFYEIV